MSNSLRRVLILAFLFCVTVITYQNCGMDSRSIVGKGNYSSVVDIDHQDHEPPVDQSATKSTLYEPVLADRYYLLAVLEDVFGPQTRLVDTANLEIQTLVNGSPCSIYEDHKVRDKKTRQLLQVDRMETCSVRASSRLAATANPKASVTRQALIARACSDLTSNPATLNHAIDKISLANVPAPSDENLKKAFRLFYRNAPDPTPALIDSLRVMMPASNVKKADWRTVINTVCISPQWQVL